jgi:DNA-binding PadR family transcriptional regulator
MHPSFRFTHHSPHHAGRGFGGGGGRHEGRGGFDTERGQGRRERIFETGALKLVVLHLLARQPSHGYDLIRAIGELVGGDYTPSPGTIYPTLTLLEDMGLAQATELEGGRKQYALTAAGAAHLAEQADTVQAILAKLAQGKSHADRRRVPELQRAMDNLKTALRLRFDSATPPDQDAIQRIAAVIDQAALDIERA